MKKQLVKCINLVNQLDAKQIILHANGGELDLGNSTSDLAFEAFRFHELLTVAITMHGLPF